MSLITESSSHWQVEIEVFPQPARDGCNANGEQQTQGNIAGWGLQLQSPPLLRARLISRLLL